MDVSNILESHAAKFQTTAAETDDALEIDAGNLTVTDTNPINQDTYSSNLEEHLITTARDSVQSLIATLFALPTLPSADGPLAQLPPPTTPLPREKPLPKPKPPTKWERFAAAKGIQKKVRGKKVWDEEKQEWVNRWGKEGKNKREEEQWITEVPANADVDHNPVKVARDARKARVAKNERQQLQNLARAQPSSERDARKSDIEKTLATTRVSTASMGRFDKQLVGEKKLHGVKRKFEPTEAPLEQEKNSSLALLSKLDSDAKKMRKVPGTGNDAPLNVRKAIRTSSKGRGGVALGRASAGKRDGKSRKGKR